MFLFFLFSLGYDFFSGYLLMAVEDMRSSNAAVSLLGELPHDVQQSLTRTNFGRVNRIEDGHTRVKLQPAEALNQLGNLGYRVVSASQVGATGYIWTMERRNYDGL